MDFLFAYFMEREALVLNLVLVLVFMVVIIILIGLSRVYLNVHYMSDVIAGFIGGAGFYWQRV